MELHRSELITLAAVLARNLKHIPTNTLHFRDMFMLYDKLIKEIDHVETTRKETRSITNEHST